MARIRTIKPELWLSPQIMNLPHSARLLFIGLITQAEDFGRGCADARRLKAAIFPGDDVTCAEVEAWLEVIVAQHLIVLYDGGEHGRLYAIPTWDDHQYIQKRAKTSRYPDPYRSATVPLPESYGSATVGSTRARIGSEGSIRKDLTRARAREESERGAVSEDGPRRPAEDWVKGAA